MSAAEIRSTLRRRLAFGLNTGAAILLAVLLAVMVNYLSNRHYIRADWSRSQFYGLSGKTKALLESLTNRVEVTVFFLPDHPAYEDVVNLLKEYSHASPRIEVERIDPNRNLARAEELARRFEVQELNVVVFHAGGRSKFVTADDLMDVDYSGVLQGGMPRQTSFKGELAFSSALQSLTQERQPIVYFLRGHGERDINDRDPYGGYSELAQKVRRDNIDVRTFTMAERRGVPDDADAVVIPGPTKPYATAEIDLLRKWLENRGRLMVLLDTGDAAGLQPLLESWNVRIEDDVVVDPKRTLTGLDLFVDDYGNHPITRRLGAITSILYMPRSIQPVAPATGDDAAADRPQAVPFAFSSLDSWAESDPEQKPIKFEPPADRPGPIPLAVAVERGTGAQVGVDIRPTRLAVFGDTDFLANSALSGGNVDLFLSALNWLLERDEGMAIAPKPVEDTRLLITQDQIGRLFWVLIVFLPGLLAILGAGVWMNRRG